MEYINRCDICGKISVYSDTDIRNNEIHAKNANRATLVAGLNALAGTRYDMYEQNKEASIENSKIKDLSVCPNCGSRSRTIVTPAFARYHSQHDGKYNEEELIKEAYKYLEKSSYEDASSFARVVLSIDSSNYDAHKICLLSKFKKNDIKELSSLSIPLYKDQFFINSMKYANGKDKEILLELNKNNKDSIYEKGISLIEKGDTYNLNEGIRHLEELGDYKDSRNKIVEARVELNRIESQKKLEEEEKIKKEKAEQKKKTTKTFLIACGIVLVVGIIIFVVNTIKNNIEEKERIENRPNKYLDNSSWICDSTSEEEKGRISLNFDDYDGVTGVTYDENGNINSNDYFSGTNYKSSDTKVINEKGVYLNHGESNFIYYCYDTDKKTYSSSGSGKKIDYYWCTKHYYYTFDYNNSTPNDLTLYAGKLKFECKKNK